MLKVLLGFEYRVKGPTLCLKTKKNGFSRCKCWLNSTKLLYIYVIILFLSIFESEEVKILGGSTIYITDKILTHSLQGLSHYAKHHALTKYSSECNVLNCYICR